MNPAVRAFCLLVMSVGLFGCGTTESPTAINAAMLDCEVNPEECGSGGGGGTQPPPAPPLPGYDLGASVTPALCFQAAGIGIVDNDRDGMDEGCEAAIAEAFRPQLVMTADEPCGTMEPWWAAKYFPSQGTLVRVAYLLGYHQDCGYPSGTGSTAADAYCWGIGGADCGGHIGDSEFIIVDVEFDAATSRWVLSRTFFSAHYNTNYPGFVEAFGVRSDHSRWAIVGKTFWLSPEFPDRYRGYPRVWVGVSKHANYRSQVSCNEHSFDRCSPDVLFRMAFSASHNIGSRQANFVNLGTCVSSERFSAQFWWLSDTECFWNEGANFNGWDYRNTSHVMPYEMVLTSTLFDCYSDPTAGGLMNSKCGEGSDRGIIR